MKEIGILFQPELARANVEGRKWMTRRLRKLQQINADPDRWHLWQPRISEETGEWAFTTNAQQGEKGEVVRIKCPYGKAGDVMWQREMHAIVPRTAYAHSVGVIQTLKPNRNHDACVYYAEWVMSGHMAWKPSIHMPRWASRFVRPITRIRCERIQSISPEDCLAEGIAYETCDLQGGHQYWREEAHRQYCELWRTINGVESWDRNPWVWVVEYAKQESK